MVAFFCATTGLAVPALFEHETEKKGESDSSQVARDQKRYHQAENESGENRSSTVARGNLSQQGIKENSKAKNQELLDLSEAALKGNIEAAQADEVFCLERQEWLVAMERKLRRAKADTTL